MIAHEPAYEQLTLSVRGNWLVLDGGVETPGQKEALECFLRRLLGVCGVKSEVTVRFPSASVPRSLSAVDEGDEGGENFKLIVELRLNEVSAG